MRNPHVTGSIAPSPETTITLDYHAFGFASTSDCFYQVNGQPRNAGGYGINRQTGSFVGQEIDLVATPTFKTYGSIQAGYGHFFAGDYAKHFRSGSGRGATNANFAYARATFNSWWNRRTQPSGSNIN